MNAPRPPDPDFGELLGPGGPLSRQSFYEFRPGQIEMAQAVWRALRYEEILLAEAGTGTGKSLAYLLPALRLDRRVVISTGTKALQEQLERKDVPLCEKLLGRPVKAVTVKGRANYLCLHYWRQFKVQPLFASSEDGRHFKALAVWAEETGTGDKAEWVGIPEDLPSWRDLNARSERCLGSHCPVYEECFVVRLRRQAEAAEVVITNHHLLFADLALKNRWDAAALPAYAHLVLDEAHEAEDSATSFFGTQASKRQVLDWIADSSKAFKGEDHHRLIGALSDAGQASQFFFGRLEGKERRDSIGPDFLDPAARKLKDLLLMRLETAALALQGEKGSEEALGLLERYEAWREAFDFALDTTPDGYARWIEVRGRNVVLGASPIEVGPLLRDQLFSKLRGAVLTSATLTVGGRFDYLRARLGAPPRAEEMRLQSPFDFKTQGLFYTPSRFPDPASEDFQEALNASVLEMVGLSRGRAFVLCTSVRSMRSVAAAIEGKVPHPVLVQGDEPKGVLLGRFRRLGNAILVATVSFWQGVDVQGEALSLVILDKLPFAVPSDPLTRARIEKMKSDGLDPFSEYQLPAAAILLQQGAGRLIRSKRDRGVVACFDVRLRRRSYGKTLIASLPPFKFTDSLEEVEAFFACEGEDQGQ